MILIRDQARGVRLGTVGGRDNIADGVDVADNRELAQFLLQFAGGLDRRRNRPGGVLGETVALGNLALEFDRG